MSFDELAGLVESGVDKDLLISNIRDAKKPSAPAIKDFFKPNTTIGALGKLALKYLGIPLWILGAGE